MLRTVFFICLALTPWNDAIAASIPLPKAKPDVHFTILPVAVPSTADSRADAGTETAQAPSIDILAEQFTVAREGDLEFPCEKLVHEAEEMATIEGLSKEQVSTSELQQKGIGVAGAVGSFLIGSMTGGIGFAAAGYLAKEIPQGQAEQAAHIGNVAAQRRALMRGIYQAKGCEAPWPDMLEAGHNETPAQKMKAAPQPTRKAEGIRDAAYSTTNPARYNQ